MQCTEENSCFINESRIYFIHRDTKTIEVDRLFSDGHSLLRVDLRTRCNPPTVEHPCSRNKPQLNFIKPSEFERFMINFDQNKANDILSVLESCDTEYCEATINHVAHQISNAFKSAASKTQSGKNVKLKTKHGNNRPWFGFKCQTARRKYHLARKKHFIHKTQSSRDALTLAGRSYKRKMNIFINKYKFTQQSKLRKMQKT